LTSGVEDVQGVEENMPGFRVKTWECVTLIKEYLKQAGQND